MATAGTDLMTVRREYGISQRDVAAEMGIGVRTIVDIEKDRIKLSPDTVARIYEAIVRLGKQRELVIS